jgi:hypothetical protein
MMGLIHDDEVKVRLTGSEFAVRVSHQELKAAKDQLLALEWVGFVAFKITLLIKEAHSEIESAPHFDQPLVQERIWHHDKNPFGFTRQKLVMKNHPRFDGFAETDLICKKDARMLASGNLMRDVKLMGNQIGSTSDKATDRGLFESGKVSEGLMTKTEQLPGIQLTGKKPVLRFIELHVMIEIHLFDMHNAGDIIFAHIRQKATTLGDFCDGHLVTVLGIDLIPHSKANACQWSVVRSIDASITCSDEKDGDTIPLE